MLQVPRRRIQPEQNKPEEFYMLWMMNFATATKCFNKASHALWMIDAFLAPKPTVVFQMILADTHFGASKLRGVDDAGDEGPSRSRRATELQEQLRPDRISA